MRLALILTLLACGKDGVFGDDTSADDSGDFWSDRYDPDGDDAPEVVEALAWCTDGSNSSGDLFFVNVVGFDRQTERDIATQGGRIIGRTTSGTEIFDEEMLTCQSDGTCEASWRSGDYGGVECKDDSDLDYFAVLVDRNGNASDEFEIPWDGRKASEDGN